MQGTAFFGRAAGAPRKLAFGGKDRHSERYDIVRYVHDGKLHYLRNFLPHLPAGQYLSYNYQHASLRAWQKLHDDGKLKGTLPDRFFRPKPMEELYDVTKDPWEVTNLASDPKYAADLKRLRGEVENWMIQNGDLGLLPESELHARSEGSTPYEIATDRKKNPVKDMLAAAWIANERNTKNLPTLLKLLENRDPALRWWGAIGLVELGPAIMGTGNIRKNSTDSSGDVRVAVAEILGNVGYTNEALKSLEAELTNPSVFIRLAAMNAIDRMGPKAKPLIPSLAKARMPEKEQAETQSYIDRMIEYMPGRLGGN
jgi:N-sulfoglucosamine sulfohydrolase